MPGIGEKSPKRFILPTKSARSSRIIKPNKRLFGDITEMCSTSDSVDVPPNEEVSESENDVDVPSDELPVLKLGRKPRGARSRFLRGSEGLGRDRMKKTISLYTESITSGQSRGRQAGRPPKRLLRRSETPQQVEEVETPESPQKSDAKETRVKEKIEKLLRSAWDDRLKPASGKGGKCDMEEIMPAPASTTSPALSAFSRSILRKARLNLNKSTLQKIRDPASLQRLIPKTDEGNAEGRCIICDRDEGENTRKFGVIICEVCCSFISNASDGPKDVFGCQDGLCSCQVQNLEYDVRCLACWLGRILQSCFMPNILHDRLRKRLPSMLKEKIPTSLARSMNLGSSLSGNDKDKAATSHTKRLPLDPGGGGGGGSFGNIVDLPGGWRRKTGSEVVVISPSGEKFKSMHKLEEFLKNRGVSADARVLFGNSSAAAAKTTCNTKSRPTVSPNNSGDNRVVMTTLPGGWTRRIKWRKNMEHSRFDTYVTSPDGRTFRSKKELNAYFEQIGKVDDIHKYFPLVNGHSDSSTPSSSEAAGFSSTEPVSSSEAGSEASSDDKSVGASEGGFESPKTEVKRTQRTCRTRNNRNQSETKTGVDLPKTTQSRLSPSSTSLPPIESKESPGRKRLNVKTPEKRDLRSRSSSRISESEETSVDIQGESNLENTTTETKHRKSRTSRLRTVSTSTKQKDKQKDIVFTDTTESESERLAFTKSPSRNKSLIESVLPEFKLPENPGLCSAWDTNLYDSIEDDSDACSIKVSEEGQPSTITSDKPSEDEVEKAVGLSPSVPEDLARNKLVLKINKKNLVSNKPSKIKNMTEEAIVSLVEEKLSDSSEVVKKSLINALVNAGQSLSRSATKSLIKKLTSELKPKKKKKNSKYQTVQFGNWSRKIKWNEKGEGKVALLHTPDGQTLRSRIELLAYFKKAGRTKVDLDYYFPLGLKRDPNSPSHVESDATPVISFISEASDFSEGEFLIKTSEDSSASNEEGGRRRRRVITDYSRLGRTFDVSGSLVEESPEGQLSHLPKTAGRKIVVVTGKSGKFSIVRPDTQDNSLTVPEPGGPRVKHVCRSQAQVLGIQRAVFPASPEKEVERLVSDSSSPSSRGNKKLVYPNKAKSGKRPLKTTWCHSCTGCLTPNCLKCLFCIDMKKYGGPGIKKKPCVMRKCLNPTLSASASKSAQKNPKGKKKIKYKKVDPVDLENLDEVEDRSISPVEPEETKEVCKDRPKDKVDVIRVSTQDKSAVFVPKQVKRALPDQKDRGDIAAGKKFIPGALVNIDYWQGYDVDEMMLSGFSVTTSSPLYPQTLCFRCGSAGKEQLLFCIWCCEGVHPFCMEDGEGPESDTEELFWVCRRCAVCHVCGAPGADSLLRCSDCRNYYHMECLGPSAHTTCQLSPDRPWEAEMLSQLQYSWPHQAVLYDVGGCEETGLNDDIVMHTELDPLKEFEEDPADDLLNDPDIHFLPTYGTSETVFPDTLGHGCSSDFDLEDSICLEESIIELFKDVDLYKPSPSLTTNLHGQELFTLAVEEYLCLGYEKFVEYATRKVEISYYRLLQIIHNELFDTLGYPTWGQMVKQNLVREKQTKKSLSSDTDTASEGEIQHEDDENDMNDLEWEDILEVRRFEVLEELQEREERRLRAEREEREREKKERERKRVLVALQKEKKARVLSLKQRAKNVSVVKRKKKRGRPPGAMNKSNQDMLDFIVDDDEEIEERLSEDEPDTPKRSRIRQPKSWEEFDKLFSRGSDQETEKTSKSSSRKVLFSTSVKKVKNSLKKLEKKRMVKSKLKALKNLKVKQEKIKRPRGRPKSKNVDLQKGKDKWKKEKSKSNDKAREITGKRKKDRSNDDLSRKKSKKDRSNDDLSRKKSKKNTKGRRKEDTEASDQGDGDSCDSDMDQKVPKESEMTKKRANGSTTSALAKRRKHQEQHDDEKPKIKYGNLKVKLSDSKYVIVNNRKVFLSEEGIKFDNSLGDEQKVDSNVDLNKEEGKLKNHSISNLMASEDMSEEFVGHKTREGTSTDSSEELDDGSLTNMNGNPDVYNSCTSSSNIASECSDNIGKTKHKYVESLTDEFSCDTESLDQDQMKLSDEKTGDISKNKVGLASGRRRRSVGRASLLASQRKAMMDY